MSKIEELARRTLVEIQPPTKAGEPVGDVVVTLAVIEIIIKCVIAAYDCLKAIPAESIKKVNSPNFFDRVRLRWTIRKVLTVEGNPMAMEKTYQGLLRAAKTVSVGELAGIQAEVAADKTAPALAAKYGVL